MRDCCWFGDAALKSLGDWWLGMGHGIFLHGLEPGEKSPPAGNPPLQGQPRPRLQWSVMWWVSAVGVGRLLLDPWDLAGWELGTECASGTRF